MCVYIFVFVCMYMCVFIVTTEEDPDCSFLVNSFQQMMKMNFAKPGIAVALTEMEERIADPSITGMSFTNPTSILNDIVIRRKSHEFPIVQRCFIKIDSREWLWLVDCDHDFIWIDDKLEHVSKLNELQQYRKIFLDKQTNA